MLVWGGLGVEVYVCVVCYQVFQDMFNVGEVLVIVQYQDDQCEILLLVLKCGSGFIGLLVMVLFFVFVGS